MTNTSTKSTRSIYSSSKHAQNTMDRSMKKRKGSFTEDPGFKRVHQEKDVLKLQRLLKNINFNYKRSEESIKTL